MVKNTLLVSILATSVFAYELEFKRDFKTEIIQDEIFARITIDSNAKTQNKALEQIESITKFINKPNKVKVENYNKSSYPIYKFSTLSKNRYIDGYNSKIRFTIKSKNSSNIESYLTTLLGFKNDNLYINYTQLGYRISSEKKIKSEDSLRLEAILWSESYVKYLSNKLNKKCKQMLINFNRGSFHSPQPLGYMKSKSIERDTKSISFSIRTQKVETQTLQTLYRYNCNDK
ncbi:MAG: SIMPL domain-containing protein [Campylobacterota bacterium]|nr:SIMPL domain-containing protein [Campylobacterota bacterium]